MGYDRKAVEGSHRTNTRKSHWCWRQNCLVHTKPPPQIVMIVLFTATGAENLGDELITLCEIRSFQSQFFQDNS
jgi:hypothetical protein